VVVFETLIQFASEADFAITGIRNQSGNTLTIKSLLENNQSFLYHFLFRGALN